MGLPQPDPAFVTLFKTVRDNRDRILAAVELGLVNSKREGLKAISGSSTTAATDTTAAAALIA